MFYQTNRTQAALKGRKIPFLSLVTLTFDLDIQSRPSDGPSTSSVWIWRKSVQRFPRYCIHKRNKSQTATKTEPYAVHCVR